MACSWQSSSGRATGVSLVSFVLLSIGISTIGIGMAPVALGGEDRQLTPGPAYLQTQARSGKALYKKHCLSCHPKGYFDQVFRAWQGEPLPDLFGVMRVDMPQNNPGGLDAAEYVDILAYILAESDYPAGSVALDPDSVSFQRARVGPPAFDE
jgi:mono/diheme cytochrome c family protein